MDYDTWMRAQFMQRHVVWWSDLYDQNHLARMLVDRFNLLPLEFGRLMYVNKVVAHLRTMGNRQLVRLNMHPLFKEIGNQSSYGQYLRGGGPGSYERSRFHWTDEGLRCVDAVRVMKGITPARGVIS